jgi:hypothetical protein
MPEAASAPTRATPAIASVAASRRRARRPGRRKRRARRHGDGDPQEHAPGADAGHHPPPLQPAHERERGQADEPRRRGRHQRRRRAAGRRGAEPVRFVAGGRGARAHRCARGTDGSAGAAIGVWVDGHRTADDRIGAGPPGGRDRAGLRLLELLLAQLDPPDLPRQRLGQRVDELDPPRVRVRAEPLADVRLISSASSSLGSAPGGDDDERLDHVAAPLVRRRDRRGLRDRRCSRQADSTSNGPIR